MRGSIRERRATTLNAFVAVLTATAIWNVGLSRGQSPATVPDEQAPTQVPTSAPADHAQEVVEQERPRQYYYRTNALSANRSLEPTSYARPLSEWGPDPLEPIDWLLFGIEQRTRYEYFDDDYVNNLDRRQPFLMRSRAFLGIKDVLDPIRFGVEFQDSRAFNTKLPNSTQDVNEYDFLQAYFELFFSGAAGEDQPLSLQVGRLAVDYVDRRLRTRNGFRNTTNAFDGFRLRAGTLESLWELEFFAAQPVEIFPRQFDHGDEQRWFYGLVGAYRGWAPDVTVEPYYFILDQDQRGWKAKNTEYHTWGTHLYGLIRGTRFDYDLDTAFQYGRKQGLNHRAFASHAELGYTFDHSWKPRLAAWLNYASGDRSPNDGNDQRFNRLFGASNGPYGFTDFFEWSNLLAPAMELRFEPDDKTLVSMIYRTNWLASKRDAWTRVGRVDPEGKSGRFIGQEIDLSVRRALTDHFSIEVGYAHFFPGDFVEETGPSPDSDRLYVSTVLSF